MRGYAARTAAIAACAVILSACGGGDESAEEASPVAESSAEDTGAVEEPVTEDEPTEDMAEATEEESTEDSAEATEEDSQDGGQAGQVDSLPSGAMDTPPETVGDFTLADDSGPAVIYEMESGEYVTVDTGTLSSPYEDLVTEISTDNTEAGAGSCGLNSGGTSAVCYQRSDDGVITLTGDAETLDLMVTFADDFAAAVTS